MSFSIRKATKEDAAGVAKVHVETWQSHYQGQVPDEYLEKLSIDERVRMWTKGLEVPKPKTGIFVAEKDGRIVGFCNVGPSRDGDTPEKTGEVYAIYVLSPEQQQGIGSALMKAALDFLKGEGFRTVTAWILDTNTPTISFYKQKGWKSDGAKKKDARDTFVLEETHYAVNVTDS